jgi:hypothetical protein
MDRAHTPGDDEDLGKCSIAQLEARLRRHTRLAIEHVGAATGELLAMAPIVERFLRLGQLAGPDHPITAELAQVLDQVLRVQRLFDRIQGEVWLDNQLAALHPPEE